MTTLPRRVLLNSQVKRFSIVAPSGGDFEDIYPAIAYAAAQNLTINNRWALYVYPFGGYKGFSMQPYVDIIGIGGHGAVVVNGAIVGSYGARLENVTLEKTAGTGFCMQFGGAGTAAIPLELVDVRCSTVVNDRGVFKLSGDGIVQLSRCHFACSYRTLEQSDGYLFATDCIFQVWEPGGADYPAYITGGDQYEFRNCIFIGGDTIGECVYLAAAVTPARFLHCTFRKGSVHGTYSINAGAAVSPLIAGCVATHTVHANVCGGTPADLVVHTGV